ncbi:PREDICTED: uncharacterized protein LOC105457425 [Wasmannia auropunctata]|uniref:uncharacterized protein LOC105457425 n=1 Tax=Wasmannia auropunctata TaxID=64793 RepID=UPI0005EE74AB|nr:PREDICTED: uncharacterized protein LOC105457425 [Wasmannia auropunctata]
MRCEYTFICGVTWLLILLLSERLFASGESGNDYSQGCAHLRCENGSRCVKRRFWCKDPPCPGMLYCSRSRKESLKGPLTCDTVRCNKGHVCVVKVRGCDWDGNCKQQLARCVSEKEYYEGAASCAGFECPSGERCILRETFCVNPPCKLIRSCKNEEDVQTWFDICKSLNCASEYECFLRRPENNCLDSWCTHMPDCTLTIEDELISKYCYGWICPPAQKCTVRIVDSCKGFNCTIERSCRASSVSTQHNTSSEVAEQPTARKTLVQTERELIRQELEKRTNTQTSYPITEKKPASPVTSTRRQSIRYTTPATQETEVSLTRQQIATTKSNLITESLRSSTSEPYLTSPYSRTRLNNYDKSPTIDEGKVSQNFLTKSSVIPATVPADGKAEPDTSRDTERLEAPRKIYIAADDDALPLPIMLEDINFFEQGYPIWIKNDPYRSWEVKDEDGWRYREPQEPYKILLPPYEPVILVKDTRKRGQFLPFFTDAFFTDLFNEAALIPLPEITSAENTETNRTDDSSNDHASLPVMEKTISTAPPSTTRDEELDNYYDNEWRPWYVIHDLERNEPQSSREHESKSSIVDLATDDLYKNDTSADPETFAGGQITDEERSRVFETRYADERNKNLATFSPPASMGQSDYSARNDEGLHGLANYPYDTISVHHIGKSSREYEESSLRQILDLSLNGEENTA